MPEIYMPLRPGNLRQLVSDEMAYCHINDLANIVLEQMLSALDYLDDRGYCHRDRGA
jgi:serine/threonine protein kinase